MIELELFLGFLRVGCFAFGGAYGAIPLIRDVVTEHGWLTDEALSGMIAVSESTPGPIIINLATYVGSSQAGFAGAALATFAVVLPAFLVIVLVAALLRNFLQNCYIQALLRGLKPCIAGVVMAVGCYMAFTACAASTATAESSSNSRSLFLFVILAFVMWGNGLFHRKKISPVLFIVLSALLGIIIFGI